MIRPINKLEKKDHTRLIITKGELNAISKRNQSVDAREMEIFRGRKKHQNLTQALTATIAGSILLSTGALVQSLFTDKIAKERNKPNFNIRLSDNATSEERAQFNKDKAEIKALLSKYKTDQPAR